MASRTHLVVVACALSLGAVSVTTAATVGVDNAAQVGYQALRVDPPPVPELGPIERVVRELTALVDEYRDGQGLPRFAWNDQVAAAAFAHSADMAGLGRMQHSGSDGSDTGVRLERSGYAWSDWGENIGYGFRDPARLLDAWIDSPPHRQHLDGGLREIGIGVAWSADGVPYWTLVVATRR